VKGVPVHCQFHQRDKPSGNTEKKEKDGTLHLTMNLMVENKTKTSQKTHDNSANKSLRDDEGNARQLPMHLTLSGKT
jgi:hypothetical protein